MYRPPAKRVQRSRSSKSTSAAAQSPAKRPVRAHSSPMSCGVPLSADKTPELGSKSDRSAESSPGSFMKAGSCATSRSLVRFACGFAGVVRVYLHCHLFQRFNTLNRKHILQFPKDNGKRTDRHKRRRPAANIKCGNGNAQFFKKILSDFYLSAECICKPGYLPCALC